MLTPGTPGGVMSLKQLVETSSSELQIKKILNPPNKALYFTNF